MATRSRRKPIKIKKANVGKTRKATGTKKGQKVPISKLKRMKRSKSPLARRRATFALNVRQGKIGGKKK